MRKNFGILLAAFLIGSWLCISAGHAQDATLIISSGKVSGSEPALDTDALHGKPIWLGDETGDRGDARLSADGERVDRDKGRGLLLAYTVPAEFIRLGNTPTRNSEIKDAATKALRGLGSPQTSAIEITMLAMADLDLDGKEEILVQAHTVRNLANRYAGYAGDVEALLVLSRTGNGLKVQDAIAAKVDPNQNGGARSIIELVALGRRADHKWDLLVRQTAQFLGKSPLTINVEIGGQQMKQPDPKETRVTITSTAVYRFSETRLVQSDTLGSNATSFCVVSDCKD